MSSISTFPSPCASTPAFLSPSSLPLSPVWLGIDLNTTGHTVVAGEPESGYCAKLGGEVSRLHRQFEQERHNLRKKSGSRRVKALHRREEELIRLIYRQISREVVDAAERLGAGIKFERLSSGKRGSTSSLLAGSAGFSINSVVFSRFQRQVEENASRRGIPVVYVDPSFTSKRCSRCGSTGLRHRKRFDCPACGLTIHADVNAAFNIAMQPEDPPGRSLRLRRQKAKVIGRQFRKTARAESLQVSRVLRDGAADRVSGLFSLLDADRVPVSVPAE
jgi:putative transposase